MLLYSLISGRTEVVTPSVFVWASVSVYIHKQKYMDISSWRVFRNIVTAVLKHHVQHFPVSFLVLCYKTEWKVSLKKFSIVVVATACYPTIFEHLHIEISSVSWECWAQGVVLILQRVIWAFAVIPCKHRDLLKVVFRWKAQHGRGFTVSLGSCRTWAWAHHTFSNQINAFFH